MARFTREFLDDNTPAIDAWRTITNLIKDGAKSVEVLARTVDGVKKWEVRAWDGIRNGTNGSNAAGASPETDY